MIRISALALVCAVALPAAAHAQAGAMQDSTHKKMTPAQRREERREEKREKGGKKEPHPELNAAMKALERAKSDLEKASHDYGGHRVEAIKSIDEAQKHVRMALESDKK